MTETLRIQHKEDICLFKEVESVETALIQQFVKAVRPEFLNALCSCNTTSITGPFYNIIDHLSTTYGCATAQMFDVKEDEVRKMTYNPTYPMYNIFATIENIVNFAELARNNIT